MKIEKTNGKLTKGSCRVYDSGALLVMVGEYGIKYEAITSKIKEYTFWRVGESMKSIFYKCKMDDED